MRALINQTYPDHGIYGEEYGANVIDGSTRWNASSAAPPCAVGSVSGPMTFNCSMIEPGQPWVMMIGSGLGCFDFTWMKCMSSPSTSVRVAIISFSKGTVSARLYLKSLETQQFDLPAPRAGFNPCVSGCRRGLS